MYIFVTINSSFQNVYVNVNLIEQNAYCKKKKKKDNKKGMLLI